MRRVNGRLRELARRLKAKGALHVRQVVVDGLRDAHHRHPQPPSAQLPRYLQGAAHRAVPADAEQHVHLVVDEGVHHHLNLLLSPVRGQPSAPPGNTPALHTHLDVPSCEPPNL